MGRSEEVLVIQNVDARRAAVRSIDLLDGIVDVAVSFVAFEPRERLFLRFRFKNVTVKTMVGGDGDPELLRVDHFWPGHHRNNNHPTGNAGPFLNKKVACSESRRLEACKTRSDNQELPQLLLTRKGNRRRHQLHHLWYRYLTSWPVFSVVIHYRKMLQFAHWFLRVVAA